MKINDEKVRYISGDMNPEEIIKFEKLLEKDSKLRLEIKEFKRKLEHLKNISVTGETDSIYFQNLLPKVRDRLSEKHKYKTGWKIAFALPLVIILVFIIYKQFPDSKLNYSNDLKTEIAKLNDSLKIELLSGIIVSEKENLNDSLLTYNQNQVLTEEVTKEIFKNSTQNNNYESIYLDPDDLVKDISDQEAEIVFENLVNKKII